MPTARGADLPQAMQECIERCLDCHKACLETVMYCLQQGGPHAEANHVRLMLDCAEICQTSANFMQRGSDLHHLTCSACAEVCQRCADDCARLADGDDDNRMAACATMCRRCAESCRHMSGHEPEAEAPSRSAGRTVDRAMSDGTAVRGNRGSGSGSTEASRRPGRARA